MSTTTQIFLYVVCICAGVLIGALVNRQMSSRPPTSNENQPAVEPPPDEPPAVEPPAKPQPAAREVVPLAGAEDLPLFTAWKTRSGGMWLEMDGQRLEGSEALQPDQRRRLVNTVLELRPWLAIEPERPSRPEPKPAALVPQPKKVKPEESKPMPVIKSILEQIDDVLQVRLETSAYKDRKLQLVEGAGGTVVVKDGLNLYEGIEAVPDPQIQELIRQAVRDWEKGSK